MIRTILRWLVIAIVVALVVMWFLGGGISKIQKLASSFSLTNLLSASSSLSSFSDMAYSGGSVPQMIPTYGNAAPPVPGSSSSGAPNGADSPYAGKIVLAQGGALAQTAGGQYLVISSTPDAGPFDIAGWSLQSPLSGVRVFLAQAASPFVMGRVNTVGAIRLAPGGVAYAITGPSPIGVSFSENKCTGYLGTLQPFVPPLPQECPWPSAEIPDTPANEARLGASCFAFMATIAPCTFPANPPSSVSAACKSEIQNKLSYNGCVAAHQSDPDFSRNSWHIYLAQGAPLWNPQHDIIRLLDGQGREVSVLNY